MPRAARSHFHVAALVASAALAVASCAAPLAQPGGQAGRPGATAGAPIALPQGDTPVRVNLAGLAAQLARRGSHRAGTRQGARARRGLLTYGLTSYDWLVTDVRLTATGPGIATPVSTTFAWTGADLGRVREAGGTPDVPPSTGVTLVVPSGMNRVFTFEALDAAGNPLTTFKVAATVTANAPLTLTLNGLNHAVACTLEQLMMAPDVRSGSPDVADTAQAAAATATEDLTAPLTAFIRARTGYDAETNGYTRANPLFFRARGLANLLRAHGTGLLGATAFDGDLAVRVAELETDAEPVGVTVNFEDEAGQPTAFDVYHYDSADFGQEHGFRPQTSGDEGRTTTWTDGSVAPGRYAVQFEVAPVPGRYGMPHRTFALVTVKEGEPEQAIDLVVTLPTITLDAVAPEQGDIEAIGGSGFNTPPVDGSLVGTITGTFDDPRAMAEDPQTGDLYFSNGATLRKVFCEAGTYTHVATIARGFNGVNDMVWADEDTLYVLDDTTIKQVELSGGDRNADPPTAPTATITTILGAAFSSGYVNGTGAAARLHQSEIGSSLALRGGALYLVDRQNHAIRKATNANGTWTLATLAGPQPGDVVGGVTLTEANIPAMGAGLVDGPGDLARMANPCSGRFGPDGALYFLDRNNFRLRKLVEAPDGSATVSTVAGSNMAYADGAGAQASFFYDEVMTMAADGTMYFVDDYNSGIRKITPQGVVTTVLRSSGLGLSGVPADDVTRELFVSKSGHLVFFSGDTFDLKRASLGNGAVQP